MTVSELKSRYISVLPDIPDDLDLTVDEFVTFPLDRAAALRIRDSERAFLTESGLPVDAAPFLSFGLDANSALVPVDSFPDSVI